MTGFSDDDVTTGLMAATGLAADDDLGRAWARQYAGLRDAVGVEVDPGETVALTLGVILMDQGKTLDAVLLLTSTRAVLGWSSGLLGRPGSCPGPSE